MIVFRTAWDEIRTKYLQVPFFVTKVLIEHEKKEIKWFSQRESKQ